MVALPRSASRSFVLPTLRALHLDPDVESSRLGCRPDRSIDNRWSHRSVGLDLVARQAGWADAALSRIVYCTARISGSINQSGQVDQDVLVGCRRCGPLGMPLMDLDCRWKFGLR
jgi:hypothetical protein